MPRFRRNWFPSARRRRDTHLVPSYRKKAVSMDRPRLVVVPIDNSKGKLSRFKQSQTLLQSQITRHVIARDFLSPLLSQVSCHSVGRTFGCVHAPSTNQSTLPTFYSHSLCPSYLNIPAIVRVSPRLSPFCRLRTTTMTSPVPTCFQVLCFLPEDPPHRY